MIKFKPYIIAEIGINHDGSLIKILKLINLAKKAGANAVKFQLFQPETFANKYELKEKIFLKKKQTLFNFWDTLKIKKNWLKIISKKCKKIKIDLGFSVFDLESAENLKKIDFSFIKIASSDIDDFRLQKLLKKFNKPIIFSTGMASLKEISRTYKFLGKKSYMLHCVSLYPTPINKVNLNRMISLKKKFKSEIGYSDHSIGISACIKAYELGAKIIEKHFTLNKNDIGPDHKCSADYQDLMFLCNYIKNSKKLLGTGKIEPTKKELKIKTIARKGIYAKKKIEKGETLTLDNIIIRRPKAEFKSCEINWVLNKKSLKTILPGQAISRKIIKKI